MHSDKPVCRDCHSACEYNADTHNGPGCSYRRHNPKVDHREELAKLDNQIRAKIKKQQFYYHRGWMKGGHEIGLEVARLKRLKNELERSNDEADIYNNSLSGSADNTVHTAT